MAIIKPLRGYRPPAELAYKVTSPPYDVMSSDEARILVQNNQESFLRVIKPEIDFSPDNEPEGHELHSHSRKNLLDFINNGLLIQDENYCIYVYQISMGEHTQTGIMAAVSVEEYNNCLIKKHEFTRPDKENDRTQHIEINNANTGPVFLTYRNDGKLKNALLEIVNSHPEISFMANDTTFHTLWKVENKMQIERLTDYFQAVSTLYIADGHHRAASASRVQKLRENDNTNHTGEEPYNYFLSVIFPHDEMQILDYNRVILDLNNLTDEQFIKLIKSNFSLTRLSDLPNSDAKKSITMYLNNIWYQLEAKDHIKPNNPVEKLDASILQNHLLEPILGIDDPRTNKRIDFVGGIRGRDELERRCQTDCTVAFALPPVSIEQLLSVADSGMVMPPKSTWFEPKLRSGMVVRMLS